MQENEKEKEKVVALEQTKLEKASNCIMYWLFIARHNLYLKGLVKQVENESKQTSCFSCKTQIQKDLKIIP